MREGVTGPPQPSAALSLEDLKDLLRRLIEQSSGIAADSIRDDSTVEGDLAMDSFEFIALQVDLETALGIECDPVRLAELERFDAIVEFLYDEFRSAAGAP